MCREIGCFDPCIKSVFLTRGGCLDMKTEPTEKRAKCLSYTLVALGIIALFIAVISYFAVAGCYHPNDFLSHFKEVTLEGAIALNVAGIALILSSGFFKRAEDIKYSQAETELRHNTGNAIDIGAQREIYRLLQGRESSYKTEEIKKLRNDLSSYFA